jgi:hypothetical protein
MTLGPTELDYNGQELWTLGSKQSSSQGTPDGDRLKLTLHLWGSFDIARGMELRLMSVEFDYTPS